MRANVSTQVPKASLRWFSTEQTLLATKTAPVDVVSRYVEFLNSTHPDATHSLNHVLPSLGADLHSLGKISFEHSSFWHAHCLFPLYRSRFFFGRPLQLIRKGIQHENKDTHISSGSFSSRSLRIRKYRFSTKLQGWRIRIRRKLLRS